MVKPGKKRIALGSGRFCHDLNEDGREFVGEALTQTAKAHNLDVDGLSFRPAGLYGIRNSRGCSRPQGMHTDYSSMMVKHLHGTPQFPRSAIWAVRATFVLQTRAYGDVRVPAGHVVFFMANFWHGGGPFLSSELRFHGFQLSADVGVPAAIYD